MKRLRIVARPCRSVRPRAPANRTTAPATRCEPERTSTWTDARRPARSVRGAALTRSVRAAADAGGAAHDPRVTPLGVTTTSTRATPAHAAMRSTVSPGVETTRPPRTSVTYVPPGYWRAGTEISVWAPPAKDPDPSAR